MAGNPVNDMLGSLLILFILGPAVFAMILWVTWVPDAARRYEEAERERRGLDPPDHFDWRHPFATGAPDEASSAGRQLGSLFILLGRGSRQTERLRLEVARRMAITMALFIGPFLLVFTVILLMDPPWAD